MNSENIKENLVSIQSWEDLFKMIIEKAMINTHVSTLAKVKEVLSEYDESKKYGVVSCYPIPLIENQTEYSLDAYFLSEREFEEGEIICILYTDYDFRDALPYDRQTSTKNPDNHSLNFGIVIPTSQIKPEENDDDDEDVNLNEATIGNLKSNVIETSSLKINGIEISPNGTELDLSSVAQNYIPSISETYDIGSASKSINNIHSKSIYLKDLIFNDSSQIKIKAKKNNNNFEISFSENNSNLSKLTFSSTGNLSLYKVSSDSEPIFKINDSEISLQKNSTLNLNISENSKIIAKSISIVPYSNESYSQTENYFVHTKFGFIDSSNNVYPFAVVGKGNNPDKYISVKSDGTTYIKTLNVDALTLGNTVYTVASEQEINELKAVFE